MRGCIATISENSPSSAIACRRALAETGYIAGQNVQIEPVQVEPVALKVREA